LSQEPEEQVIGLTRQVLALAGAARQPSRAAQASLACAGGGWAASGVRQAEQLCCGPALVLDRLLTSKQQGHFFSAFHS